MRFIIILLLLSEMLYSQNITYNSNYSITGKVIQNENNSPLLGADIVLRTLKDSLLVSGSITKNDGFFILNNIKKGEYILSVYHISYSNFSKKIVLNGDKDIGKIVLKLTQFELDEVIIKSKLPTIQRKPDRTILNIENTIYSHGENVFGLLKIVPEVRTDGLGNIKFRGQDGVIVYLDERRIRLSSSQLRAFLKGIPSESIKNIELISIPGAQYEAEGTAAVLNIVTKKEYQYGLSGTLTSYYEQHRFSGAGLGLLLNYKENKTTYSLNLNYSLFNFFNDIKQKQIYLNKGITFDEDNKYKESYNDYSAKFGVDYELAKNHKIGVKYRINYVDWDMAYNSFLEVSSDLQLDSILTTNTREEEFLNDQSVNVYYEHQLDTMESKISVDLDYIWYKNPSDAIYKSDFFNPDFLLIRPRDSSFIKNPISVDISTVKVDLDKKFKNSWNWLLGVKLSSINTKNENTFFTGSDSNIFIDISRSNKFEYSEDIYAFYSSLSKNWNKWSFNLGIRLENTNYDGISLTTNQSFNKDRLDFFPSFFLQYKWNDSNQLNMSFSRRILRPAYEKLNPFEDYQNVFSFSTGNPDLNPAFSNSLEFSYLYKNKYFFNTGYKNTSDLIGDVLLTRDDFTVISTYENLSNENYYFFSASIPIKVSNWWNINTYFNLYDKQVEIKDGSIQGKYGQSTFFFYGGNSFSLKRDWSLELNGYYQTKSLFNIYELEPQGAVNFTIKKSLLKDKLNFSLSINDIFFTQKSKVRYVLNNVIRDTEGVYTSQIMQFNVSYNFSSGKKKVEPSDRNLPGEDEKNRID